MQNAPSVICPVGRSAFYGAAMAVVGGLSGAALILGWWSSWQASPANILLERWVLGLAAWLPG
jgi:hypothetical protein